jgi:hypothetical protein
MGLKAIEVKRQKIETRVLEDKWLFDTVSIANGNSLIQYFVTKQNKNPYRARFAGDESLVNEGKFFEWVAIEMRVLADRTVPTARPVDADMFNMATEGYCEAKIADEVVLEENMIRLFGGFDFTPVLVTIGNAAAAAQQSLGSGQHGNVRKFAVSKIVPGGRNFKLQLQWANTGGVLLVATQSLQVAVYGIEQVPTGKVLGAA